MLRPAGPRDLAAVGALTVAAYSSFVAEGDYTDRLRDAATRAKEAELWVAEGIGDDELLGTVTICPVGSPWREIARPDEGEFRMLAVAPHARGHGVGEALVRRSIARFADDGIEKMVLSTLPTMSSAHRLYRRLGFVRAPGRDWSPTLGVDLLAFERR